MASCSSCGASIVWIKTATGKSMPCDLGLVRILVGRFDFARGVERPIATVIADDGVTSTGLRADSDDGRVILEGWPIAETITGRVSHFATCPAAAVHRSRRTR